MKLYKPKDLLDYLSSVNIKPKKALSQNFLVDKNTLDKMIEASELTHEDIVLEIGPGPGVLTNEILGRCEKLVAVEKDDAFANLLNNLNNSKLSVINTDFIKMDFNFLKNFNKKLKVISSIPYHLTTPIISKLLENHLLFSSITLLVQKEAANRLISQPRTKGYNYFSVLIKFYSDLQIVSQVSRNCFFPKPKVDSAIIKFNLKSDLEKHDHNTFFKMLRLCFSQRRKTLASCLKPYLNPKTTQNTLLKLRINPNARAEDLSLENFLSLREEISDYIK
ncbi:MAG: 16S rRNA (adenine(1518)-N(6)/adenine(1519)-N(6))-dimethyltransferase RsmA [Parachlamydiales bacterium]|jgi:16S rRNA (adenine1518-N6/adenine1519-N6)-dimethyltransferase